MTGIASSRARTARRSARALTRARPIAPGEMWPAWDDRVTARMLRLASGLRVRVVECGPPGGSPVLFLHGWGCVVYAFKEMLPAVGNAGFRAIAADLKGHGLSDKPLVRGAYTSESMTAHVLEIMDALGLGRAALAGHSMGGGLAARVAIAEPGRVDRLVLLSPVGFGRIFLISLGRLAAGPWFTPATPLLVRRRLVGLILLAVYASDEKVTQRDIDEFWAPAQFPEFVPAMRAFLREFSWAPFDVRDLEALRTPQLVIFGTKDLVIRFDEKSPPLRPRPQLRVVKLPGAGHMAHAERTEEANRAVIDFLTTR
jgi:pimeloyl-ACP methyl ester carboxylesterase